MPSLPIQEMNTFGFCILAGVLSFLYIVLLRWFAKVIVYTTIVIICTLLFTTICASSYMYSLDKTQKELLYTAIASSTIFVITITYLVVIRKKINIASEVLREASKAVIFFPSSLAFPIFSYFVYTILTIYFILGVFPMLCNRNCNTDLPSHAYFFCIYTRVWIFVGIRLCDWICTNESIRKFCYLVLDYAQILRSKIHSNKLYGYYCEIPSWNHSFWISCYIYM